MARLNDQFMEALTVDGSRLRIEPVGYSVLERDQGGVLVDVSLDAWHQPYMRVHDGEWKGKLLKGGVAFNGVDGDVRRSDVLEAGLHVVANNQEKDRWYRIADSAEEEVLVSVWDPDAPAFDPEGFPSPGKYGDFEPASPEDAEIIKENAQRIIDAARAAVDACVT